MFDVSHPRTHPDSVQVEIVIVDPLALFAAALVYAQPRTNV